MGGNSGMNGDFNQSMGGNGGYGGYGSGMNGKFNQYMNAGISIIIF